jgi:hypothetical protein
MRFKSFFTSNFIIRLRHWEYWPFGVVYFPFFFYWLWLSLRARSLLFFSASNPSIINGGMFGESKFDALNLVPEAYKPKTILIQHPISLHQLLSILETHQLKFPLVFKPDIGERGFMVKRIFNEHDAARYLNEIKVNFLAQELIDSPIECGVFYTRFPSDENGQVTSLVLKEMLVVTGNGTSTLRELVLAMPRAKLQYDRLKNLFQKQWNDVIPNGELIELNSIGNHCLGTKFLDGETLINKKLSNTFDAISKQIPGFYFGRYDLRCASLEDLYEGKIKIMELNGCGAEPAHIYAPGFPILKGFSTLRTHLKNMYHISMQNHKRGIEFMALKDGLKLFSQYRAALK